MKLEEINRINQNEEMLFQKHQVKHNKRVPIKYRHALVVLLSLINVKGYLRNELLDDAYDFPVLDRHMIRKALHIEVVFRIDEFNKLFN